MIWLFYVRLKVWVFIFCWGGGGGVLGKQWQFFGVQKSSTAYFVWSPFTSMELDATCACEKGGVVTVMLIFLLSGLDSTK